MCIFIAALMVIVLYAFLGVVDDYQLSEIVHNSDSVLIAQGWEILSPLWALLAFSFLAGVLVALLVLKLLPAPDKSSGAE